MKTAQVHLKRKQLVTADLARLKAIEPHLVLGFGNVDWLEDPAFVSSLTEHLGAPCFAGCSTAGEITNKGRFDETMVLTGLRFEASSSRVAAHIVPAGGSQQALGISAGTAVTGSDLRAALLFTTVGTLDGSSLLHGLKSVVGESVHVTGGIAGDSGRFKKSFVFANGTLSSAGALVIGLYGPALSAQHGVAAGFQSFGGVRTITKAEGSTVLEIEGRPALLVYKEALGRHAAELPANGLMFPFALLNTGDQESGLIRAVLGIDEARQAVLLAGDVTSGARVKLMRAHNESLTAGARAAAATAAGDGVKAGSFGLLISCVARKLVMGEAIDDELEAATALLTGCADRAGFYAYGEFGPFFTEGDCQLHNQTITITVLSENVPS